MQKNGVWLSRVDEGTYTKNRELKGRREKGKRIPKIPVATILQKARLNVIRPLY